ncbi:MAG: AMP-binding protein [Bradyrhizobium sp.]|uniref:acyl-CoA synthetase n=1 Tax=Bradyrhizobium sp. TaxID=376 RepID=UPI0025BD5DC6|nr:AMP-binding protein [Bradyrhizobium sp.]MBI5260733.1 AMP-binding protein [Bradyrhizobium sp.]
MADALTSYRAVQQAFRWDVPDTFNFAADVVDRIAREADGPALIWTNAAGEERTFTFSEMSRLASRFASALHQRGLRKGDRILVMMPRIPEWQIAIVGCLKLGAVPIPCIEMLTPKDIAYRVENSGARGAFVRAEHAGKFDGLESMLPVRICIGEASSFESYDNAMAAASEDFAASPMDKDDPAILYYTSGSTGNPKGVLHATRALYAWRMSARYWLGLSHDDVIWCTADTGWSKAGTSILFGPWSWGACALFYDGPFEPKQRLHLLEKYGVTVYCAPGTELFRVVAEDVSAYNLGKLRRTVSAGEALNTVVSDKWREATGRPILEAYGQTETLMTVLNIVDTPQKAGSMGLAAPGVELGVIDGNGRRLPPGTEGDIALLTPNPQLMLGYWRDEARTRESFVDGPDGRWFVTGDLGVCDEDGYFFYRGRRDDIISSAGYRIGPSEVENAVLEHPDVLECAVVASPDKERGEIVKAFIVLRPGVAASDALAESIQECVKRSTAPYKYPRAIEFVGELPKTATGKTQRRALRDLEQRRSQLSNGEQPAA